MCRGHGRGVGLRRPLGHWVSVINFSVRTRWWIFPPAALLFTPTLIALPRLRLDGHLTAVLQPEGLRFLLPATLTLGYAQCNPQPSNTLSIVYLNGPLGQILQWLPSILHLDSHTVTALIGHFSVYAGAERR